MDNFAHVVIPTLSLIYSKYVSYHQEGGLRDLWVPISGAIAQQRQVETIANNVANANTPGFKKDKIIFKEYLETAEKGLDDIDLPNKEWKPEDFNRTYGAERSFVKVDGTYTDHEQGQLTPTNNPLDVALNGPGMFEVLTPNGVRYTRRGTFTISPQGKLVTDQGFLVLAKSTGSTDPNSRTITLPDGKVNISMEGEISGKDGKIADLSLSEFKDQNALRKEGNSLFSNPDIANAQIAQKTATHQGFVEQSNVNAIEEMSALINANRNFESIQKVIKAYDSMSSKAVNDIPRF